MPSGELQIPVTLHRSRLWVGISVTVAERETLLLVLDTGAPISVISPGTYQNLRTSDLFAPGATPRFYRLTSLTAADATPPIALPDIEVRVLPRLARLQVDGLLGLDFFRLFQRVCFHVADGMLSLAP